MSELNWNWVYFPYLDAPNKQEESALKAGYIKVVDKSEADKVIENRDKEIASLKDSIGKLLKCKTEQVMDEVLQRCLIYGEGFVPVEHVMRLVTELRNHKYKLCLAKASEWRNYATFCGMQSHCHNHRGFGKTAETYTWKECHGWKCVKRWLKIAKHFKEAK